MDILAEMAYEIKQMKSQLENMLRLGNVVKVHAAEGLVDVAYDDLIIERVPLFMRRAGDDREYWMPSIGEQGMLLSPSGDLNNATFHVGINSEKIPVPRDDAKWTSREWKDGATETYDKEAHEYILKLNEGTHRKVNRSELQDKRDKTELNMDGITAVLERVDKGHFKTDSHITEITFPPNAKVEMKNNELKLTLGVNSVRITLTKVELRTPTSWIVLTPALANVFGATFAAGATNMFAGATPVVYAPVLA